MSTARAITLILAASLIALLAAAADALSPRGSLPGAPRCGRCDGPTPGRIQSLGRELHSRCFGSTQRGDSFYGDGFLRRSPDPYREPRNHHPPAEKCRVCGEPIVGRYYETTWGERYCAHHLDDLEECYSCDRPICDALTGGGVRYEDGRSVCNICRNTAVDSDDEARQILLRVRDDLELIGFDFGKEEMPAFRLVNQTTPSGETGPRTPDGVTHTLIKRENGEAVGRNEEINVLFGLPFNHFASVAAHELGHIYIFRWGFPPLPEYVEEGLCELMACVWLKAQMDPECEHYFESKVNCDDPVYGEGLRAALEVLEGSRRNHPVALFEYVRNHGCFPRLRPTFRTPFNIELRS